MWNIIAILVLTMSAGYDKYMEVFEDYRRYLIKECGSSSQYLNSQYSDQKLFQQSLIAIIFQDEKRKNFELVNSKSSQFLDDLYLKRPKLVSIMLLSDFNLISIKLYSHNFGMMANYRYPAHFVTMDMPPTNRSYYFWSSTCSFQSLGRSLVSNLEQSI